MSHYDQNPKYGSTVQDPTVILGIAERLKLRDLKSAYPRVLDLGCGDGRLSLHMAKFPKVVSVVGVDYSSVRHKLSQRKQGLLPNQASKLQFHYKDVNVFVREMAERNETVDLVTMFEVLEHLEEPAKLVQFVREHLLNPGGSLIGSVPIQHVYVAHLRVFESAEDVVSQFRPDEWYEDKRLGASEVYMRCDSPD